MKKGNTRERIILAALDLFSAKGFDGTTVDEIAARVGIKAPTIYKYLKGKADIINSLSDTIEDEYNAGMDKVLSEADNVHSGKDLKEFSMNGVFATINNETIVKMRKVLNIEQYRNHVLAEHATWHSITKMKELYTEIFSRLIDEGVMIKGDPEIFAMEFYSPTTLLIHMIDRQPEKKSDAIATIERYIDSYIERYCIK